MSQDGGAGRFHADFIYTEEVLSDFEKLYLQKKETPLPLRIVLGVLGAGGAVWFGRSLYLNGLQITSVGYLLICSIMLVIAFARGKGRQDETTAKYRKYYLNRRVTFRIGDEAVEMKLEDQKNGARSRFREIYALYDTDLCFYFVIKGKAYYILPKQSVEGGSAEEFVRRGGRIPAPLHSLKN